MKKCTATSFVASYLEAWNEQDAGSVTEHLCSNGRYIDEVLQEAMNKKTLFEELVEYFQSDHSFYEVTSSLGFTPPSDKAKATPITPRCQIWITLGTSGRFEPLRPKA